MLSNGAGNAATGSCESFVFAVSLIVAQLFCGEKAKNRKTRSLDRRAGTYTFYNKTGETVTELYLINNLTGEQGPNYAVNGFAADAKYVITRSAAPEEIEAGFSMTVAFKTEGGYEAKFETLHIEEAPITLLAQDALTGATPISFFAPAE